MGMAIGGTFLLIQRVKNEGSNDQGTIVTAIQAIASMKANERLPIHRTPLRKSEAGRETPEQVLGELEKQDF
jgi:hypothetical protein